MQMKKFLSSLSAKVVLAIAVCSTLLTACYEKAPVVIPEEPADAVYYLVGSIYNGANSQQISGTVTLNGESQTGTTFSFKLTQPGTYTLTATAAGYMDVTRSIVIVEVPKGQVSVNRADIALFDANGLAVVAPSGSQKIDVTAADVQDVAEVFGMPSDVTAENGNLVLAKTNEINPVEDVLVADYDAYVGFIMNFEQSKAIDMEAYLARCISSAKAMPYAGSSFEGWATETQEKEVLFPGKTAIGYNVVHNFALNAYVIEYDGAEYTCATLEEVNSVISVVFGNDSHDDHEGDDSHGDNHGDGHGDGHGGTNAGGGAGDAE